MNPNSTSTKTLGTIDAPLTDLGLTDKNASGGCCGGGSCGCGHASGAPDLVTNDAVASDAVTNDLVTTELEVTGMTCEHCVSSVTEELGELAGVESVRVQLNAGGVSTVTVASRAALDPHAIESAVSEAGYALAEKR